MWKTIAKHLAHKNKNYEKGLVWDERFVHHINKSPNIFAHDSNKKCKKEKGQTFLLTYMRKTKVKYLQNKERVPRFLLMTATKKKKKEKVPTFLLMGAKKEKKRKSQHFWLWQQQIWKPLNENFWLSATNMRKETTNIIFYSKQPIHKRKRGKVWRVGRHLLLSGPHLVPIYPPFGYHHPPTMPRHLFTGSPIMTSSFSGCIQIPPSTLS